MDDTTVTKFVHVVRRAWAYATPFAAPIDTDEDVEMCVEARKLFKLVALRGVQRLVVEFVENFGCFPPVVCWAHKREEGTHEGNRMGRTSGARICSGGLRK